MTARATIDQASRRKPRLADRMADGLRGKIVAGKLAPGAKLPAEHRLAEEYGVSRTVVREAVARLSADGLVHARQGAGVFVTDRASALADGMFSEIGKKISMVLNVLEVRMAIEMESAALAAQRRSPSQAADIVAAYRTFDALLERGESTGSADFAFHRAIATATNNPFYVEILDALGLRAIPRELVTTISEELRRVPEYQVLLQAEHREIVNAISAGDPEAARQAMRNHLSASQHRYMMVNERRYQGLLESADLHDAFVRQGIPTSQSISREDRKGNA
ncbi:MAG: FadR/GntR family transcriptional regulator [Rhizobiaceae bacterium]